MKRRHGERYDPARRRHTQCHETFLSARILSRSVSSHKAALLPPFKREDDVFPSSTTHVVLCVL